MEIHPEDTTSKDIIKWIINSNNVKTENSSYSVVFYKEKFVSWLKSTVQNEIREKILMGEYQKAKELIDNYKKRFDLFDFLTTLAWDTKSMAPYGMVVFLLSMNSSTSLHMLAACMLMSPLRHIEGACMLALFHTREAVDLDPDSLAPKKLLLEFFEMQEPLISYDEAATISKEILKKDPKDSGALKVNSYFE